MEKRTLPTPAGGVPGPFTKPTVPVVGAPHVSCTTAQPSMSPGWTTTVAATATAAVASAAVPAARAARSRLLIIPPSLDTSTPYPGSGHRNAALHARGVLVGSVDAREVARRSRRPRPGVRRSFIGSRLRDREAHGHRRGQRNGDKPPEGHRLPEGLLEGLHEGEVREAHGQGEGGLALQPLDGSVREGEGGVHAQAHGSEEDGSGLHGDPAAAATSAASTPDVHASDPCRRLERHVAE